MKNFVNVGQNYFNRVKNISLLSGYIYDKNYFFHNRKVIVIDIGVWLIIDTIYSKVAILLTTILIFIRYKNLKTIY